MNYQTYNNYHYHKSKTVWWLHRRVDNEYTKKRKGPWVNHVSHDNSVLIKRIIEDLK